jgi:hypothetical protein
LRESGASQGSSLDRSAGKGTGFGCCWVGRSNGGDNRSRANRSGTVGAQVKFAAKADECCSSVGDVRDLASIRITSKAQHHQSVILDGGAADHGHQFIPVLMIACCTLR